MGNPITGIVQHVGPIICFLAESQMRTLTPLVFVSSILSHSQKVVAACHFHIFLSFFPLQAHETRANVCNECAVEQGVSDLIVKM